MMKILFIPINRWKVFTGAFLSSSKYLDRLQATIGDPICFNDIARGSLVFIDSAKKVGNDWLCVQEL
jgi:hypothetical protein